MSKKTTIGCILFGTLLFTVSLGLDSAREHRLTEVDRAKAEVLSPLQLGERQLLEGKVLHERLLSVTPGEVDLLNVHNASLLDASVQLGG